MSRRPDPARKPALLEQILTYLLDKPLSSLSLRPLADALGVSTFTLVYHFGSRDQLIDEIVSAIAARAQAVSAEVTSRPITVDSFLKGLEQSWEWATRERSIPLMRLEFEAALLESHHSRQARTRDIFTVWQTTSADSLVELGLAREQADIEARLLVDTMFGLQYDLIVNRDAQKTTESFRCLVEHTRVRLEGLLARL